MSGGPKSWRKRLSPSAPRRKDGSCGSSVRGSCLALNLRPNLYGSLSDKTLAQAFEFQPTMEVNLIEVRIHEVSPPAQASHYTRNGTCIPASTATKNCEELWSAWDNLRLLHTTEERRQHPQGGKLYLSLSSWEEHAWDNVANLESCLRGLTTLSNPPTKCCARARPYFGLNPQTSICRSRSMWLSTVRVVG
jgi:hypothetical protein